MWSKLLPDVLSVTERLPGYRNPCCLPPLAIPSSNNGQDSVPIKYLAMITIVKNTMHEIEKPEV